MRLAVRDVHTGHHYVAEIRGSVYIVNTVPVPGTQAVARAAALLRIVTAAGTAGLQTPEIATTANLTRSTTHRLLAALQHEGLVDRERTTGAWLPGPELYLMGSVAAARFDVSAIAREVVRSLASRTEESAFLSVRRGDETVCLVREDGSFPIRSFVLSEGVRFPLGVASAGLAILAFQPQQEIDAYLSRNPNLGERFGRQHAPTPLRARLKETRDRGFAVNPGLIVQGSYGIGAAVFTGPGQPEWALSLTGVEFRFGPDRLPALGRALLSHAHQLSSLLGSHGK